MRRRLSPILLVMLAVGLALVWPFWCWAETLTGGMSDTLIIDSNSNTQANPGDTLRYTTTITNTGAQPATNVQFTDTLDTNTTLVSGSVRSTPVAIDDSYAAVGNVVLNVPVGTGLLANDVNLDNDTLMITAPAVGTATATAQGGSVTVQANGSFSYQPPTGFSGTDTFTYTIQDPEGNDTATVTFGVNLSPIAVADTYSVLEDATLTVPAASGVLANDTDTETDPLTAVLVSSVSNGTLNLNTDGSFTYTPATDFNGTDSFTYRANDGQSTSNVVTVTITVTAVNDAPSFTKGPDQTVLEGSGAQSVANWATAISAGPANEAGQTLTFLVTGNTNAGLFSAGPAVAANGTLTYTPATNANGTATITLELQDNGGTTNGGVDTSAAQTFVISVTDINNAPSFTKGPDQTILEDSGAQTVAGWATAISAGPANEAGQTLTFLVTGNTNAGLFSAGPAVAANGTLTYTPAANANGTATITLVLQDNGGTANGGVDTSAPQTFVITVTAVNDAPTFTKGPDQTVLEDSSAQTVAGWATSMSPGPADEAGQTLTFVVTGNTNAGLFSAGPAVAANGTLTYTPAANATGTATITLVLQDNGGTANGGVDTSTPAQTFTITITTINDAPSFTKGPDQTILEDSGAQTVAGWATAISAGPANEAGQTLTFVVTGNTNAGLFSAGPAVAANGTLTYTPAANANGAATITLVLQDNGGTANGGVDTSTPPQTFTITVTPVNDPPLVTAPGPFTVTGNVAISISAPGLLSTVSDPADGAGAAPFTVSSTTFTSTQGGNVAVNTSTGAFTYNPPAGYTGADSFTYQVCDSGVPGSACTAATVNLTINDMIWFIDNAAAVGDGRLSSPFNALAAFQAINNGAGNNPAPGDNIFLFESATAYIGPVTLLNNQKLLGQDTTVSLATAAGITLAPNSVPLPVTNSANGVIVIVTNTTASGVAIGLANAANATIRGLTIGNVLASGIGIANLGAGFGTLTVLDTTISTDGQALDLDNGTFNATFGSVSSSGGVNNMSLTTLAGTANLGSGALSGATGIAFLVSGGTVAITYGGSLTKTTAGRLIDIQSHSGGGITLSGALSSTGTSTGINIANNTGGTLAFTNASKTVSTGANPAVTLSNNSGATINFTSGGLVITTTSGTGFSATGGGTVTVQGAGNTITSGTGIGLNVATTTIGSAGLTFRSIASNGAASGIVLNTTGTSGGLTVTGTGGAGTGGTIQNATGPGVSLTSTSAVSLTSMQITNGADDGIRGTTVTGLSLTGVQVTTNGNAVGEAGIDLTNLLGTSTWSAITVSGSAEDNVVIRNSSGTLTSLNVTASTLSTNSAIGNDGFLMEASGTANMTASLTGNTFTAHRGDHFQAAAANSGVLDVVFSSNTLSGGHATALGQGITINAATGVPGYNGTVDYNIDNNTINGSILSAITVNLGTSANTATMRGTVSGNTIGTAGQPLSCSAQAYGIAVDAHGNGTHTVAVTGNTIRRCADRGMGVLANDGNGTLNVTVTGNTVTDMLDNNVPNGTPREAIELNLGATSTNVFGQIDSHAICLALGGAGALANSLTGGTFKNGDIRIRQRFRTRVVLPGYTPPGGNNFHTVSVQNFLAGNNLPAGITATATTNNDAGVTTDGYFGGAPCPTP